MATDGAIQLTEYLETPESEWLYTEIEGQPDDYPVSVQLPGPEKPVLIVTNAGTVRDVIRAMVQTRQSRIAR